MAEPAAPIPRPRLELSLLEARTRFVQLARLANLTRQSTVITDGGRPIAAIVPAEPGPGAAPDPAPGAASGSGSGAAPDLVPGAASGSGSGAAPDLVPGAASGSGPGVASGSAPVAGAGRSAAGWLRRIETVRADLQRQHRALEVALDEAWRELDRVRPPGSDPGVDALRLAHADVRRR